MHCDIFDQPFAEDANMIACSVVGSRLDYAIVVLYGVCSKNINRFQSIVACCVVKLNRTVVQTQLH